MTYFLKSGSRFNVSTKESMDLHESLPVGTYAVKYDQMAGRFYLEAISDFENKGKVYGDTMKNVDRILRTFDNRTASTGVMLTGEKGSGKTLLAKLLSTTAATRGIPTVVINDAHCGEQFNSFMQMIEQPVVVLFDEFEKVYDKQDQEKMLTLLDGVYPSKKLFVLTCNDKWRVDAHMRNRPGRIFYMMDFDGLEQSFIIEYCQDNLINKVHIESVCKTAMMFAKFNFDMLKALVEEMNRYDESPQEAMHLLNAKPEFSGDDKYKIELQQNGALVDPKNMGSNTTWEGNPLTDNIGVDFKVFTVDADGERDYNWESCQFRTKDLIRIDPVDGKFVFANEAGDRAVLTRSKEKPFRFYDAF